MEIKTYITLGESREIQSVFLESVEMGMDELGNAKIGNIKGELAAKAQNKAIEVLIVSVNGKKENVLQAVMDLPKDDGEEILVELDKIQGGLEKKTK